MKEQTALVSTTIEHSRIHYGIQKLIKTFGDNLRLSTNGDGTILCAVLGPIPKDVLRAFDTGDSELNTYIWNIRFNWFCYFVCMSDEERLARKKRKEKNKRRSNYNGKYSH